MELSQEIIWCLIGIALVFAEFFIPNFVIAFFGFGALITALTTWINLTPAIHSQLLVFIISSILFLILLRRYLKKIFMGNQQDDGDNIRFNIDVGKIIPVVEFIEPGEVGGKVRYQGTIWEAKADEPVAPGESVRITGYDNITLIVEKIKKKEE